MMRDKVKKITAKEAWKQQLQIIALHPTHTHTHTHVNSGGNIFQDNVVLKDNPWT